MVMWGTGGEGEGEGEGTPRMSAATAISTLRECRPGSIESQVQEKFVAGWVTHRWKVAYTTTNLEEPHEELELHIAPKQLPQGIKSADVDVLLLVGKPGSSKSWLSSAISKRRPPGRTIIISQDECGSRNACEAQFAMNYRKGVLVILDRCNPDSEDRACWLKLLKDDMHVVAIHFDNATALCRQSVDARLNHPTIRAGRGGNALAQMERLMRPPQLEEGYAAVLTIRSFHAAWEAIKIICSVPPITKFPRTRRLLSLGCITPDDIVDESFSALAGPVIVEEQIDGANIGFSLDAHRTLLVQNRSHYISHAEHAQFRPLQPWLERFGAPLLRLLDRDAQFPERYVLYGEWCVARHSIHYGSLPDPFLAFDLYDRTTGTFLSRAALAALLEGTGLVKVSLIAAYEDGVTRAQLLAPMDRRSCFANGPLEGVYLRVEDARRHRTVDRGKVVRGDFLAGNRHWSKGPLVKNEFVRTCET